MSESSSDRPTWDLASDAQERVKGKWHTPTLTVLGDVRTITQAGGVNVPDGGGNNQS